MGAGDGCDRSDVRGHEQKACHQRLPALAAFGLWFLPAPLALLGLAAVFIALLAYDIGAARAGAAPAWHPALRLQLTGAVVLCLVFAAWLADR